MTSSRSIETQIAILRDSASRLREVVLGAASSQRDVVITFAYIAP